MIDFEGLLEVARCAREAPPEKFNMDTWCGTACCAIGNFCLVNESDKLGVALWGPFIKTDKFMITIPAKVPIAERFGISLDEAHDLFIRGAIYRDQKSVVKDIEDFVAKKRKEYETSAEQINISICTDVDSSAGILGTASSSEDLIPRKAFDLGSVNVHSGIMDDSASS